MDEKTHKEIIFNTQIGTKATVQRTTVGAEAAAPANLALARLGLACHPSASTDTQYMGSAAVHVYYHTALAQVFLVSQVQPLDLYKCPEILAIKATEDLVQAIKVLYGHGRQRRRSGF